MVEASSTYDAIIASNFETFQKELVSPDWNSDHQTAFYELFIKEAVPVNMVKVTAVFNSSPSKVKDVLYTPDSVPKYDDSKESRVEVENGPNYKVYHTKGAKFFMVDPRDTLIVMAFRTEANGAILIAGSSIEHKDVPEVKGRVRAQVDIMGYLLEPVAGDANKCKFTYLGKMDPKGSVPGMVINKQIRKQGENMEKLDKLVSKL